MGRPRRPLGRKSAVGGGEGTGLSLWALLMLPRSKKPIPTFRKHSPSRSVCFLMPIFSCPPTPPHSTPRNCYYLSLSSQEGARQEEGSRGGAAQGLPQNTAFPALLTNTESLSYQARPLLSGLESPLSPGLSFLICTMGRSSVSPPSLGHPQPPPQMFIYHQKC